MLVSSSSESACNASFWQGRLVQFRLRSIGCLCVAILEFHVLWAMRGRRRWKRVGSAAGTPTPGLAARSTAPEAWHANRCIVASPRSTSFPKMSQVHAGERNFADICRQARRRASPMLLLPRWACNLANEAVLIEGVEGMTWFGECLGIIESETAGLVTSLGLPSRWRMLLVSGGSWAGWGPAAGGTVVILLSAG